MDSIFDTTTGLYQPENNERKNLSSNVLSTDQFNSIYIITKYINNKIFNTSELTVNSIFPF